MTFPNLHACIVKAPELDNDEYTADANDGIVNCIDITNLDAF